MKLRGHTRVRGLLVVALALAACTQRKEPDNGGLGAPSSPAQPSGTATAPPPRPSAVASVAPAASPSPTEDAAPPEPEPKGSARLVVQHVEAVCMVGQGANGQGHFKVGEDLILEVADTDGAKPSRDHVFCSKWLADGGEMKPRLGIWRNCRQDPSCRDVTEAGAGRATVQCGRESVSLEVVGGRTILRGPFGERLVAPHPMRIEPTKRERRDAHVDC